MLEGSFIEGGEVFEKNLWFRFFVGMLFDVKIGLNGVCLWIKFDYFVVFLIVLN